MNLYDITTLQIDSKQGNLYDLTTNTFILKEIANLQTVVLPEQEMRIDLVSYSIYGTTDYADLIMDLNDIDNPLNIKSGDVINYITLDLLDYYRQSPAIAVQQRNTLLNSNKVTQNTQSVNNRQQYIENNYQLPPTFLQNPGSPITVSQGNVTINPIQ